MKELQNNFTTPEQSKQLLELGVPAYSADCYYTAPFHCHIWIKSNVDKIDWNAKVCGKNYFIPCWSVGRLMEIIRICNLTTEKPLVYIEQDNIHAMITAIADGVNNNMLDFSKLEE